MQHGKRRCQHFGAFFAQDKARNCKHNVRFQTTAKPPTSDGSNDVCDLFREIGDRIATTARYPPLSERTTPSKSMQRKSAASLTSEFCESYLSLPGNPPHSVGTKDAKQEFIQLLLKYDVDEESISAELDNINSRSLRSADIRHIRELCTPQYEAYFNFILASAQQDLGVAFLVSLRRDVREVMHYVKFTQHRDKQQVEDETIGPQQLAKLRALERSIKTILTSLFRPGVLDLQQITYDKTPAGIVEQIALKEAVHPLQSLEDLRKRLGGGRRCFAFFHPALPNKPLVFVHVALLPDMPTTMSDLEYATESNATCATFYSITNTEPGLSGVDLGNHLIKSVVQVLQNEFPKLQTFCTLSPIPKFRQWLEGKIVRYHEGLRRKQDFSSKFLDNDLLCPEELQQLQSIFSSESYLLELLETLKSPKWHITPEGTASTLVDQLEPVLMKLAAYYLTIEKHHGRPLCPVAKFHIRNGAEMYRLNYMADTSAKGMRQSCGIMINYQYVLDEMEGNRVQYEINGHAVVKDDVKYWLTSNSPNF